MSTPTNNKTKQVSNAVSSQPQLKRDFSHVTFKSLMKVGSSSSSMYKLSIGVHETSKSILFSNDTHDALKKLHKLVLGTELRNVNIGIINGSTREVDVYRFHFPQSFKSLKDYAEFSAKLLGSIQSLTGEAELQYTSTPVIVKRANNSSFPCYYLLTV